MAYNPNAVFISPSSISAFKSCPRAYYYQYVYKNPKTGLKIQLINPKLALGAVMHDVLAQFLRSSAVSQEKEQLFAILNRYWSEIAGEKGGFSSAQEESQYKNRAIKMLENFWANPHFKSISPIPMPDFPKLDLGEDLILTGKLDWIEKEGENMYHIIDFKTGEKEEKSDSIQLSTYAVLAGSFLTNPQIRASYWYLDREKDFRAYELSPTQETLEKLKQIGLVIKNSRLTNSFRCISGGDSCWACRDFAAVIEEQKGKMVSVDYSRKQEIYIVVAADKSSESKENTTSDLPF
ncbi:PD-(D/E)XK nuclease family protein [Candidatus Gottesmanbacteria bacterium]|nr:PD-(D/E)XK nuclease family protein [Candidatus Gottesmanbacteria bacterium]